MTPSESVPRSGRLPRVGLARVAEAAGVSVATASRALSGQSVRAELLERVQSAAQDLGYVPDFAAQAVARGSTRTVALLVDYLRSPFGVEITKGVVGAASQRDLVVTVTGAETQPGDVLEMIASVRGLRPRSLILATARAQDPAIREELTDVLRSYVDAGGSVALVGAGNLPFPSCSFDEEIGAVTLGAELVALGYRRPLVFNGSAERPHLAARADALVAGLLTAGLSAADVRRVDVDTAVSVRAPDDELIDLGDADVVVCVEGAVIPAVYRHIRAQGLRIGTDVGVTGYGGFGIANTLRPHLSTVLLPLRQAGERAFDLTYRGDGDKHAILPSSVRMRASTPRRTPEGLVVAAGGVNDGPVRRVMVSATGLGGPELGSAAREFARLAEVGAAQCVIDVGVHQQEKDTHSFDAQIVWGPIDAASSTQPHTVIIGEPVADGRARVSIEIEDGFQSLLEYLYELGHRSLVYLGGRDLDPHEAHRRRAIARFAATHPAAVVHQVEGVNNHVHVVPSVADLAGATGVLTSSDEHAVSLIAHLVGTGLRVPDDISVAGFGDDPARRLADPALTTIQIDAAAAAQSAWALLRGWDSTDETHSVPAALVIRDSTGPAPVQSPAGA